MECRVSIEHPLTQCLCVQEECNVRGICDVPVEAVARMVLDPKNSHNDYGSFHSPGVQGSPHHAIDVESSSHQVNDDTTVLHSESESSRLAPDMTQSDLYQRQPLLPPSAKNDSWSGSGKGSVLHSPSSEYYDVEDKTEGLSIHRNGSLSNGIVKIDVPPPLREEPRFPKEKWKTFVAFLMLVVNFIITTATLALVHERVPDRDKYGPLPDIFLDNVKAADWALDVSEILIMISTNTAFIVLIFHKHRYIVMRRVFMILSLLYLLRSITMFVTVLPVASTTYYCSPKANATNGYIVAQRVWQLISGFGLSINGKHTYCGDYIYSGHTVILTMSYLIIAEYSPKRCFPVHWISWIVSVVGVIMVLVAHGHYAVDVIIAYYVTTTLFWMYHTLANNANLKQNGPNNFLARLWWFPVFRYFEKNVGGPVPRQYEWPLPWPRWCHGKHPNRNS
ncbi:phosphatidylcholine:ceramide cholinephosphotransferase 2-like isoform X1 [Schistocerca serialis cubense]|uniref:phosphatidylcholine:ceramide cholinephosphotransferase 2-like isoform X1 n=1 Tax=Schistocerca serialis cubense TaxID=2023355 RepID=UPI00214E9DD4|nr:phosphatidylcholine:ceramide cholinephosphotransferase 2-like isoform X1 [Schistocerca serialis cubense]